MVMSSPVSLLDVTHTNKCFSGSFQVQSKLYVLRQVIEDFDSKKRLRVVMSTFTDYEFVGKSGRVIRSISTPSFDRWRVVYEHFTSLCYSKTSRVRSSNFLYSFDIFVLKMMCPKSSKWKSGDAGGAIQYIQPT